MNTNAIPHSDYPLILELIKTIPAKEVAEKWEVCHESISKLIARQGTSCSKIREEYRIKYIKEHPLDSFHDIADALNVSPTTLYKIKRKILVES